jgi:hypothetical protein
MLLLASLATLAGGCGRADEPPSTAQASASEAVCVPAEEGMLRARVQGAIDAEIDWAAGTPQCRGAMRPGGDGVRLMYRGQASGEPLLVLIGVGPLRAGEAARNVPVNLTLVREGSGRFFATQGDDKCAMDELTQEPVDPERGIYRLTGRGYCTQPARAVAGEGSVLVSRFDVTAIVDFR